MKNYEQEQQKSLEKQANRDVQYEKKPTKDHARRISWGWVYKKGN